LRESLEFRYAGLRGAIGVGERIGDFSLIDEIVSGLQLR